MSDKERLREIMEKLNERSEMIDWLIEQAEKAVISEELLDQQRAINMKIKLKYTKQKQQLKQVQSKAERYEKAIKECVERLNEGGSGTRSFVYEKLTEVMEGTECMGK